MCDRYITSEHVDKLGHNIQEIRERALLNISSKLERGFIYDNDLARSKELLLKLLDWFKVDPKVLRHEEVALQLLKRIILNESGIYLIDLFGAKVLLDEFNAIRKVPTVNASEVCSIMLETITQHLGQSVLVPPLDLHSLASDRSCGTSERSGNIGTTATTIEGFVNSFASLEVCDSFSQAGGDSNTRNQNTQRKSEKVLGKTTEGPFKYYTLLWQWLIGADRHVLESVEETLRNPTDPSALLNSCEFFSDVLLQDFPAEVFLQRPAIVKQFHDLLWSCPSSRITTAILKCLVKLTKELTTRINYHNDPNTHNLKLNNYHSEHVTPRHVQEREDDDEDDDGSRSTDCETITETMALMKKQMNIPQYCLNTINSIFDYLYVTPASGDTFRRKTCPVGMNTALVLLKRAIALLKMCLRSTIWDWELQNAQVETTLTKFRDTLCKYGEVLQHFRIKVLSEDFNETTRLIQLHLLCNFVNLYVDFIPATLAANMPANLKHALSESILDASLSKLFPQMHEHLLELTKSVHVNGEEDEALEMYGHVTRICQSMSASIQFLREWKSLPFTRNIALVQQGLGSLQFHRNMNIVNCFVDLCANKLSMHSFDEDVFDDIDHILLTLLSHNETELRLHAYRACQQKVLKTIGAKYNVSKSSAPGSQILFLLRRKVLGQIATYGFQDGNEDVQRYCEDILVHVLKCKILVSEDIWKEAVSALIPIFPVLLTQVLDRKSLIGRNVLSVLDPDRSRMVNFSHVDVLRLNVGLLFLDNADARMEAVSRLCWLLSTNNAPSLSSDNTRRMTLLPHLNNLHDKALAMICQLDRPLDFKSFRTAQTHFYQPSSLHQVIDLLSSSNIEPVIRRSAITQISVMMEDPILHSTFLECHGLSLIKDAMISALTESDFSNYPDSVIPCLSVLKNLAVYNATVRVELSQSPEYFTFILRSVFMFCAEDRVKQDGAVLLFLITFCDYIRGSPVKNDLSVLHVIQTMLRCPFDSKTHGKTSEYTMESLTKLKDNKWALTSLQIHWNIEWFNGLEKLLQPNLKYDPKDNFSDLLKLNANNLLAIKSTSIEYSLTKHLNTIHESHEHVEILDNLHKLTMTLNLYDMVKGNPSNVITNMDKFDWEKSFFRYLNAPPAGQEDNVLLAYILEFLCLFMPFVKNRLAITTTTKNKQNWISSLLSNKSHYFNNLLTSELVKDQEPDVEKLLNALLELINVCILNEERVFSNSPSATKSNAAASCQTYPHLVKIIANNLQCNNAQHFYNLAYLDRLLETLVNLTAAIGWSESKSGEPSKQLLKQLFTCSFELLSAFHCGKGPTASDSLMGLSITRHVLLVLNHLLGEMQHFNVKNWEEYFLGNEVNSESTIESIAGLRYSRDVVIRATSMHLLAGLAMSGAASIEMMQGVNVNDAKRQVNLWKIALAIVCDQEESSIMRENAALLLRNLSSHIVFTNEGEQSLMQGVLPVKLRKLGKNTYEELSCESQRRLLIALLDACNFFIEVEAILKRLYTDKVFNFHEFRLKYCSSTSVNNETDDFMFVYNKMLEVSNISDSINSEGQRCKEKFENTYGIVTSGVVRGVSMVLSNLIALVPDYICAQLQETGIIKLFFKCVTLPSVDIEHMRDLIFYADILQMNAAVCSLLARCANRNVKCLLTIGNTRDCLDIVTALLDPAIYIVSLPHLLYLRNKLWSSVYNLLEVLLTTAMARVASETQTNASKYDTDALIQQLANRKGAFFLSLYESISTDLSNDLQLSALTSLTSLLKCSSIHTPRTPNTPPNTIQEQDTESDCDDSDVELSSRSIQNLLDNTKTPRTSERVSRSLNNNHNSASTINKFAFLEDLYFGSSSSTQHPKSSTNVSQPATRNEARMAGAEICKILLEIYEVMHLQQSTKTIKSRKKTIVMNTLTALLLVSTEAKQYALEHGLLPKLIEQLKLVYVKLSLENVDCMRRIADKKRLNPLMIELVSLFRLLMNFLYENEEVKTSAANFGLTDTIHKLWNWLFAQKDLLIIGLKLLCTLTTNCTSAAASLPLTSSIAGTGPRKTPSGSSLLHVLCALINKEMEHISRTHCLDTLQLTFRVLHNAVAVNECRFIIVKNNFLQSFTRLHPQLTKRQKPWDLVELYWLEFLNDFSLYPEGRTLIGKMQDVCDILMALCSSPKSANRLEALATLRNVAFHQGNKARLLASGDFLNILSSKLTTGTMEEANIVVTVIWAMAANSQKAKLVFRCARLDGKLQDLLRVLHLANYANIKSEELERLHYVISILNNDKSCL